MKRNIIILGLALLGLASSCSLDPTIADKDNTDISSVDKLRYTIDGSYYAMVDYRFLGRNTIIAGEVRADNTFANGKSNRFPAMSSMDLLPTHADVAEIYMYGYRGVANTNKIINTDLSVLTDPSLVSYEEDQANINHIIGEAYTARALIHFELLKLFGQQYINGGTNLGITYNKEFKADDLQIPRGTVEENKKDLYADIENALVYFEQGKASSHARAKGKTILTKDAAYALKSRVATYFKEYAKALEGSSQIVDKFPVTPMKDVVDYWAAQVPGDASIFELARNAIESPTINGITNIYRNPGGTGYGDVVAFDNLITDAGFEEGDIRADSLMINDTEDSRKYLRNMGKYPTMDPIGSDNIKVFRIEEVVLNHAEALQATGGDALTYLNKIAEARGASAYTDASLENILKERRKELLFEGFRFHDLARHGLGIRDMDPISNNHGAVPAGDYRFAMPMPQKEIDSNRESVQNPGY